MTRRADFNADDWAAVTQAPALAAAEVIGVERGGTLREAASVARVYNDARQRHDSELIDELVASPPAFDAGTAPPGADAEDLVRRAMGIVVQHASTEETQAYGDFVVTVARTAAMAHKEGGLLGIGGKRISDREQAVLNRIEETVSAARPGAG